MQYKDLDMASGGPRKGAGRPKGEHITRTAAIVSRALEQGITPLEVLTKYTKFYASLADDAISQMYAAPDEKKAAKLFKVVKELTGLAKDYANAASPYIHPKLNAITQSGPNGGPIQLGLEITFAVPKTNS
jgi:hypothetical protein